MIKSHRIANAIASLPEDGLEMLALLQLCRIKHYIKNILVLLPLFFSGEIFSNELSMIHACMGVAVFCMLSSAIYIINDIRDVERDRQHPVKCMRPLARGAISLRSTIIMATICMLAALGLGISLSYATAWYTFLFPLAYAVLNLGYSFGLKNQPLIEISILASGFVLRVLYGGSIAGIEVSDWLYLTIICISFYLGMGKRRNELDRHGAKSTRSVLKRYSRAFLDKNMYMFLCLAICFYSLWAINHERELMLWTVPFVMFICMRYSLRLEASSEGDPVDMILKDKQLIVLGIVLAVFFTLALYD